MVAWSSILVVCHATLVANPRAAVVSLDGAALAPAQHASALAALAVHGYDAIDPVDSARLQGDAEPPGDPQALTIEAKKAFHAFDSEQARARLAQAQALLYESPRFLSERALLADLHLLEGQIALSEGRSDEATEALARAILLEPERTLHPGVYPPDLLEHYAAARTWLDAQPRGALLVESWPAGANVYVDGVYRGTAPVVVDALSAGWHYATAALDDRGTRTRPLRVEGGRSTQVDLFVPDAALLTQLPTLLPRYRAQPLDEEAAAALLRAVGADLLIGCGRSRDAAAQRLSPQAIAVVERPRDDPAAEIDARVGELLQALARRAESQPAIAAATRPGQVTGGATGATDEDGASPWLWVGAGAGALLVAGGLTAAVVVALNWPRPLPPADRVDIYLGGPSP